jgi:flagellar biosynthesis/type III secretory pathway protein FliH
MVLSALQPPPRIVAASPERGLAELLYTRDFARPAEADTPPPPRPVPEDITAAYKEGFWRGYEQGAWEEVTSRTAEEVRAMVTIAREVTAVRGQAADIVEAGVVACAEAMVAALRKLAPSLLVPQMENEVADIVAQALTVMDTEPVLSVRVPEDMAGRLSARLLSHGIAVPGRVEILGDAGLALGQAALSWRAGRIAYRLDERWETILSALLLPEQRKDNA